MFGKKRLSQELLHQAPGFLKSFPDLLLTLLKLFIGFSKSSQTLLKLIGIVLILLKRRANIILAMVLCLNGHVIFYHFRFFKVAVKVLSMFILAIGMANLWWSYNFLCRC